MKKEKKTDKKDIVKEITIVTEENQQNLSSQSEWNIERCIKLQIIWFNWFWKFTTGKFWIKTSGYYNSRVEFKSLDGIKFQLANGERKCLYKIKGN